MPWRVTSPMYERQRFVLDAEHTSASFAELCRRYGVSRKTGYKWLDRYTRFGPESLADRSHRPQQCPHATSPAVIREILQLRQAWRWVPASSTSACSKRIPLPRCPGRRRSIASWYDMARSGGGGAPTSGPIPAGPTRQSRGPT